MGWEWFLGSLRVHSCMVIQKNLDGWRWSWGKTSVIQTLRANLPEKVQQEPQKVLGWGEPVPCALWAVEQVLIRVGGGGSCFFGDGDISLAPPCGHDGH